MYHLSEFTYGDPVKTLRMFDVSVSILAVLVSVVCCAEAVRHVRLVGALRK